MYDKVKLISTTNKSIDFLDEEGSIEEHPYGRFFFFYDKDYFLSGTIMDIQHSSKEVTFITNANTYTFEILQ